MKRDHQVGSELMCATEDFWDGRLLSRIALDYGMFGIRQHLKTADGATTIVVSRSSLQSLRMKTNAWPREVSKAHGIGERPELGE